MKSRKIAHFDRERCVACGACIKECPRDAIAIRKGCYAERDAERCVGCGKCADICPAGVIEIVPRTESKAPVTAESPVTTAGGDK